MLHKTNDPRFRSWIPIDKGNDFPLQNLPFGIFVTEGKMPHAATRIGDIVIDLGRLASEGLLDRTGISRASFCKSTLNDMIACGRPSWRALRETLFDLFEENNPYIRDNPPLSERILNPVSAVEMLLPLNIGDYTDFYSSIDHATNLGKLFRDPENALYPNWRHLPVGYHGRTSSILVSETPVYRPKGQMRPDDSAPPVFGPTRQLDFELEVAFITGKKTETGDSLSTYEAENAIFGFVLFNDLSARDIQKWEYVPLGPFLGKNFASIISPWIVTLDALEPFRTSGPEQEPEVLPYLSFFGTHHFDINLEVFIQPEGAGKHLISSTNYKNIYWNIVQQLAHQTVNGCNINIGDIYASGTISGPDPGSLGSLIEITGNGKKPVILEDGVKRTFLEDGDTVIFKGYAEKEGLRIGFGEASTKILPSKIQKEISQYTENGKRVSAN